MDEKNSTESTNWKEVWQAAHRNLEERIVPTQYKAWIQPLELLETNPDENNTVFQLAVINDFSAQWLRDHHQRLIEEALTQVAGSRCTTRFVVKHRPQGPEAHRGAEPESIDPPIPTLSEPVQSVRNQAQVLQTNEGFSPPSLPPRSGFGIPGSPNVDRPKPGSVVALAFDPRFDFDNFIVGSSNQFAHASAIAVSERPGEQYNPLFLYSQPGLGKTHLLYAIGNQILRKNRNARVAYLSAEGFVNELIESLKHQKMPQFRRKYRDSFDILLIDDIQFIAGKKQTEEEFFHTFNALYSSKRQIVLTSDRPPKEIQNLEERIRTRFEWGLVADIQPPEIETRIAILKQKAERDDIYLPDDVATFLASHIKSNVRELEGTLIRLQAQASLTGAEISLEMAKQELRHIVEETSSQVTVEAIQSTVAKHFKLKMTDLKSTTRTKAIAVPRQIAMFLARKYTGFGWKMIGDHFGKDHTTVMHAYEKIDSGIESDPLIRDAVEAIQNQL